MNEIVKILMERDRLPRDEAEDQLARARRRVAGGEDLEEILREEFGLEPDCIFDLVPLP